MKVSMEFKHSDFLSSNSISVWNSSNDGMEEKGQQKNTQSEVLAL
mgnify:CR=1 FL=1